MKRSAHVRPFVVMSLLVFLALLWKPTYSPAEESQSPSIYAKPNLVAWCIVPFDAAKRGPQARAKMLNDLGLKKVAYDWRQEHVADFEDEILAYKEHGLEFFAFWDTHEEMFNLFAKYNISPQVWKMLTAPNEGSQQDKVEAAGRQLMPLVERTRQLGCKLGIYNHGGWTGEPSNMVAVCKWLRENADADHVGIVYNFHHGHEHVEDFARQIAQMKPYLFCVNLNGMNDQAQPKILAVGEGQHEIEMMKIVKASGYDGPIGILDHRTELDTEESLRENLIGMKKVLTKMKDAAAKTY
ncbi:MAG: TIM barrel protein [Pirellulaceae bacterium]|nr:TIM barrel protein [Pirellulaceae bacterium]